MSDKELDELIIKIRDRRIELNMSYQDLANLTNIPKSTLQRYETGYIKKVPVNQIGLIAKALNISPGYLMGWEKQSTPTASSSYPYIAEPVAAGIPTNIEALTSLPAISVPNVLMGKYAGAKGILFMRVNGESMNKVIPNQAFIAVDTRLTINDLKSGDIVVFVDDYEGYSVKRFHRLNHRLVFRPESDNPEFFDLAYKETDNIKIVGKVVAYMVNIE